MLTPDEENYLATIPEDKKFILQEFNPAVRKTTADIIAQIKAGGVRSEVRSSGSSELGIAGQNDIDLDVLSSPDTYQSELAILKTVLGPPKQEKTLPMKWEFSRNGFEVELYLSDSTTETFKTHSNVFTALKNDPVLREKYEKLKRACDGGSFRDYMRKKFEFFHEILK